MPKPAADEHVPYYSRYIDLVTESDLVTALETEAEATAALLKTIDEPRSRFRYADGKWSVREVVAHITDAERVFAFRAFAFARGEQQPLPGFDEKEYAKQSNADDVPLSRLTDAFLAQRKATVALLCTLPPETWSRRGTANGDPITVNALAYVTLGHERHHMGIVRERYLGAR